MNQNADGFIRLMLARPFVRHVEGLGLDPQPALSALGLEPDALGDPSATAHAEIVYGLANALAETAADPFLGCHVGEGLDVERWPPFQQAAQEAQTVGDFLTRLLIRIPQESSSVRHSLSVDAAQATYSVARLVQTRNRPVQIEGFGMALYLRLFKTVMARRWSAAAVSLETPCADAIPAGYMGVRILPSVQSGLTLKFPSAWLHSSFPKEFGSRFDRVSGSNPDLSIITALRSAAKPHLADIGLNADRLATALGLGVNRLEAALKLQNTTPARELKRLRIDEAKSALQDGDRSIAEIGRSLGYSDQSHFARFFRSQTGLSPRDYRKRNADAAKV